MEYKILTFVILIFTLTISTLAGADAPVLTIDSVEGNHGILTINYTVVDTSGVEVVTDGWQFSTDGSGTWLSIDAVAIWNNAPKPAGSSFITWDTQAGANNLADKYYGSVSFRMFVKGGNTWKTKSPMPTGRSYLAATVMDGKIYAIGGYGGHNGSYLSTVEQYDPSTDSWQTLADMHTERYWLAAAAVNGRIHAIGGYNIHIGGNLNTVEQYDPSTDSWQTLADMHTERDKLAATVMDGKIYAIGGYGGHNGSYLSTVEQYDPSTDSWQTLADMHTGRADLAAAVVDEKIYAIGGHYWDINKQRTDWLRTIENYNPGTNSWRILAAMPTGRAGLAAAVVDEKIYAIGGYDGRWLSAVEEYNPSTDSWRAVASMPTARHAHAAVAVDGKIYAIGGRYCDSACPNLNTVEEYTPPRESEIATSDSFPVTNEAIVSSTPVFSVGGVVKEQDGTPVKGGLTVVVQNETKKLTQTTTTDDAGKYAVAFINHEGGIVAETGDMIKVTVKDSSGEPIGSTLHTISDDEIKSAKALIDVKIDGKVPTSISLEVVPAEGEVELTGKLEPAVEVEVMLKLVPPKGDVREEKVQVGADGIFSYKFKPEDVGEWIASVSWAGNDEYYGCQSEEVKFIFNPSAPGIISVEDDSNGRWLKLGDMLTITVRQEDDGKVAVKGSFRIGDKIEGELSKSGDHVWTASYVVNERDYADGVAVVAELEDEFGNKSEKASATEVRLDGVTKDLLIDDISPKNTSIEGGTEVTITGKGFASGATVTIGGKKVTDIQVNQQGTEITVKAPPITIRELLDLNEPKVTVTNPDGKGDTLEKGFQYYLLFQLSLVKGWNVISFPGDVIEPSSPDGFFGTGIIQFLNANHETPDAFELGEGYWILANENIKKEVKLIPKGRYTLKIKRGWNLVGSAYGEACMPEGVVQLNSLNTATKQNERAARIEWGLGYWALAIKDCEITVDGTKPCIPAPSLWRPNTPPLWTLHIQVMDENRITTTRLTIGIHPNAKSEFDSRFDVALPPSVPGGELPHAVLLLDGDFPLRLAKKILPVPKSGAVEFVLQVENHTNDATLSWNATQIPDDWSLSLINQTSQIDMRQQSTYSLPKGKREMAFLLKCLPSKQPLPQSTALLQNFPNPFNPETWIPYQLASSAQVSLTIYDIHGRIVRQLPLGQKSAGMYVSRQEAAYWDGRNEYGEQVSSGMYFYLLRAGSFDALRKMVITK